MSGIWITPVDDGFEVMLDHDERDLLRMLPGQMRQVLAHGGDQVRRLFPPAYQSDALKQAEYDELMHDELTARHMDALDVLEKTADAQLVSADDLNGWIRALNSVRILLGTRLGIDADEDDGQELAADHPQIAEWAIYYFLTALQGDVVEALTGSLAPPWNDD